MKSGLPVRLRNIEHAERQQFHARSNGSFGDRREIGGVISRHGYATCLPGGDQLGIGAANIIEDRGYARVYEFRIGLDTGVAWDICRYKVDSVAECSIDHRSRSRNERAVIDT